jgi:hypothetical protein
MCHGLDLAAFLSPSIHRPRRRGRQEAGPRPGPCSAEEERRGSSRPQRWTGSSNRVGSSGCRIKPPRRRRSLDRSSRRKEGEVAVIRNRGRRVGLLRDPPLWAPALCHPQPWPAGLLRDPPPRAPAPSRDPALPPGSPSGELEARPLLLPPPASRGASRPPLHAEAGDLCAPGPAASGTTGSAASATRVP